MASPAKAVRDFIARFVSDTDQFDTDKVEAQLNDVEKAAKDAGKVIDREFEGMGDSAKQFANDVEAAADKMRADLREAAREGGQAMQGELRDTGKETGKEVGAEVAANIGEGLQSGDYQGMAANTMQGLASGFAALPGIGIPLALAAGAAGAMLNSAKVAAEEAAAVASAAYAAAFNKGLEANAIDWGATLRTAAFESLLTEQFGSVEEGIQELTDMSGDLGINVVDVVESLGKGGTPARDLVSQLDIMRRNAEAQRDAAGVTLDSYRNARGPVGEAAQKAREQRDAAQQTIDKVNALSGMLGTVATQTERGSNASRITANALGTGKDNAKGINDNLNGSEQNLSGMATEIYKPGGVKQGLEATKALAKDMAYWTDAARGNTQATAQQMREAQAIQRGERP